MPPPRPDTALPAIADATRAILGYITSGWVLVLAITLFMLYEARTFREKLHAALGKDSAHSRRIEDFGRQLGTSMGVLTFTNVLVALGNGLILLALGVPNALLWAALSFLLNYIPDVGFIISVIPPTVATLLHHGALPALGVLVAFILLNAAIDEILYPRLLGTRLDLAPFWTLVSLIFWGWLLGVAGAILAVPLTMLVKLMLDSFDATRPLGTLLTTGRAREAGRG
jgi:predicted PurR-regulated permease PerM